jgi:hypothetical protein
MKHLLIQVKNIHIALLLLVILCIGTGTFLNTSSKKDLSWQHMFKQHRRHPVSQADISHIAEWMTFEYLTKAFGLPDTYLQEKFHSNDARYPKLTLKQYAQTQGVEVSVVVSQVKVAISQFLVQVPHAQ